MKPTAKGALLPHFKPYKRSIALAVALMLIEVIAELLFPIIVLRMIDQGVLQSSVQTIVWWGSLMGTLALIGFVCGIINTFYASDVSQGTAYSLRRTMFERLQRSAFMPFQRFSTASLVTRLSADVTQLQNTIFLFVRLFLRVPLLVVGSVALALGVNASLAGVLVVLVPLILVILGWTLIKGFQKFRLVQIRLDEMNAVLRENVLGMVLIRVFGRREHETDRFADSNNRLSGASALAMRLTETAVPCLLIVMNFGMLVILWLGSQRMDEWGLQAGEVVAVVNYAIRVTSAYAFIGLLITDFTKSRAAWKRISELLSLKAEAESDQGEADDNEGPLSGALRYDRVSFQYGEGGRRAVEAISFELRPGELGVVMGATGAGKTTLLQLVPRIFEASEGEISVGGVPIRNIGHARLRASIGYVPQETVLFRGTIGDNLRWGNEGASEADIVAAAQAAHILSDIMRLPDRFDTVLADRGSNLSGGQRQRLAIARALVRRPALLLLDDCTSALDAQTEHALLGELRRLGCTTLLVSHKIKAAEMADVVVLLDEGRQMAVGRHEELRAASPLYREIAEAQRREERA